MLSKILQPSQPPEIQPVSIFSIWLPGCMNKSGTTNLPMRNNPAIKEKFNSHQDRLIALGQMVSSVAHELSNPLTTIIGTAQLLYRRNLSSESKAEAQRILQEAERATRIARDLL